MFGSSDHVASLFNTKTLIQPLSSPTAGLLKKQEKPRTGPCLGLFIGEPLTGPCLFIGARVVMATEAASSLLKEISSINARGSSIILSLESDKWETRASTLDTLLSKDVDVHAMLVLERCEDEDPSVRAAAVEALLRSPRALHKHSKFVALKLQNNNRQIQLLALELLAQLEGGTLSLYLRQVQRLADDKDPAIRAAVKRICAQCDAHAQQVAAAAAKAAELQRQKELEQQRQQKRKSQNAASHGQQAGPYRVGGRAVPMDRTKTFQ